MSAEETATPLWVTFLAPAATVVAVVVTAYLAVLFANRKVAAERQYKESADIGTELRRKVRDIRKNLLVLSQLLSQPGHDQLRRQLPQIIVSQVNDLLDYYEDNKPWLSWETRDKVKPVVDQLMLATRTLREELTLEQQASHIQDADTAQMLEVLTGEVEKILGTHKPWWRF